MHSVTIPKHMNACPIRTEKKFEEIMNDYNWWFEEKIDGMRAFYSFEQQPKLVTRLGYNRINVVPHLKSDNIPLLYGTIIDTEIHKQGMTAAEISGILHRNETTSIDMSLHVFDILYYKGACLTHLPLSDRRTILNKLFNEVHFSHMKLHPFHVGDSNDKQHMFNTIVKNDGEGLMFKHRSAKYICGKRPSNNWYKWKKIHEWDCFISGFTPGEGKYLGQIGSIVISQYGVDGVKKIVGHCSGIDDTLRYNMTKKSHDYIGKVITVCGMERTKDGLIREPRFVRFRHDKKKEECFYE